MSTTQKYIGQVCDYEIEYLDNVVRIWDDGSEITVEGDCVTDKDADALHKNLRFSTIGATGDDDSDLVKAWAKIEKEVREYFDGFEVEINA